MEKLPTLTRFALEFDEPGGRYLQIHGYYTALKDMGIGYSEALALTGDKFYLGVNTIRNLITLITKYPDKGINKAANPAVYLNKDE